MIYNFPGRKAVMHLSVSHFALCHLLSGIYHNNPGRYYYNEQTIFAGAARRSS